MATRKLSPKDIYNMIVNARTEFLSISPNAKLSGMNRSLHYEERLALSWYNSILSLLRNLETLSNQQIEDLKVELEVADSKPETEDQDWEQDDE